MGVSDPQGKWERWGLNPQPTLKLIYDSPEGSSLPISDFAFFEIALDLLFCLISFTVSWNSDWNNLSCCLTVQGSITSIIIKVPYIGILDTTAETFAKCRVEVREYLKPFYNWPRGNALLPTLSGCPAVIFSAPYQFKKRQSVCALST